MSHVVADVARRAVARGRQAAPSTKLRASAEQGRSVDRTVDEGAPVTEEYKKRDNTFTGKIHSATVELQAPKIAGMDEVKQAEREAAKRKTLTD